MSLALVQRKNGGTSSSVSSLGLAFTTTTGAGSLIVALYSSHGTASSVTDSAGNTYVRAGSEVFDGAFNHLGIFYCKNATANAGTVTLHLSAAAAYTALSIYEISGADTSAPLDQTESGTGSGTAIATAGFTLASSPEIICAMIANFNGGTLTSSPYTLTQYAITGDAVKYFADEYHIASSNEAATATDGTSENWIIIAASFKAASGGGFTAVNRRTLGPRVGSRSAY